MHHEQRASGYACWRCIMADAGWDVAGLAVAVDVDIGCGICDLAVRLAGWATWRREECYTPFADGWRTNIDDIRAALAAAAVDASSAGESRRLHCCGGIYHALVTEIV